MVFGVTQRIQTKTNDAKGRMHNSFILLFAKELVVQCSWRGGGKNGPKIPMNQNVNVIKLFKRIGEDDIFAVNIDDVERFLKNKLDNAQSSLQNCKGKIKSSSKIYHTRNNRINK